MAHSACSHRRFLGFNFHAHLPQLVLAIFFFLSVNPTWLNLRRAQGAILTPPTILSATCSTDGFSNEVVSEAVRISAYLLGLEEFMTTTINTVVSVERADLLPKGPTVDDLNSISFRNGTETVYFQTSPNRLVEVVWKEWGDRAIDLDCVYDLIVANGGRIGGFIGVAALTHGCVKDQPNSLTELCALPPFNETCPKPSDAVSTPTRRSDYPKGGTCPSFCLDPMRFRNSFRQWFSDFSTAFSAFAPSFDQLYPGTVLSMATPANVDFSFRPDIQGLNTTLAELSISLVGERITYAFGPAASIAIPKANPNRNVVWAKPRGEFYEDGGLGSIVDVVSPVYVDNVFIGVLQTVLGSQQTVQLLEGVVLPEGGFNFIVEVESSSIVAAPVESYNHIFCPSRFCDPETQTFNESRLDRFVDRSVVLPSLLDANPQIRSLWTSALAQEISVPNGVMRYVHQGNETSVDSDPTVELTVSWAALDFGSSENWVLVHIVESHRIDEAAVWSLSTTLAAVAEGTSGVLSLAVSNQGSEDVTWVLESTALTSGGLFASPSMGALVSGEEQEVLIEYTAEWSQAGSEAVVRLVPNPLVGSSSCFEVLSFSLSVKETPESSSLSKSELLWISITPAALFLLTCFGSLVFFRIQAADAEAKRSRALVQQEQDFVAFTFHELRTPLSGAAGFLEYALQAVERLVKGEGVEEAKSHVQESGGLACTPMMLAEGKEPGVGSVDHSVPRSRGAEILREAHVDLLRANHCYNHTLDILNHVLDMAKLARNELSLAQEPIDIHEICFMACVMQDVGNPNVGLRVLVDEGIPAVSGDTKRLKQVFLNLLANALSCTHFGYVILQCEVVAKPDVDVPMVNSGSRDGDDYGTITLRFSVHDTGVGIPFDMQEIIFSQYECLDRKVGTGLGLSVCSKLVQLMGGTINIRSPASMPKEVVRVSKPISEPQDLHSRGHGPGSCFWFELTLPLAGAPEAHEKTGLQQTQFTSYKKKGGGGLMALPQIDHPSDEEGKYTALGAAVDELGSPPRGDVVAAVPLAPNSCIGADRIEMSSLCETADNNFASATRKWRVLVVDDVLLNRQLLRRRFERVEPFKSAQWECHEAVNGENALDLLRESKFDFVTMDENMSLTGGTLTGTETVKAYRRSLHPKSLEQHPVNSPQCIIIAVSGNVASRDKARYLDAGMDAVWGKPLPSTDQMVSDILSCVHRRSEAQ